MWSDIYLLWSSGWWDYNPNPNPNPELNHDTEYKFKIISRQKWQETIYKGNLIIDSLKGILHWGSWIVLPNTAPD